MFEVNQYVDGQLSISGNCIVTGKPYTVRCSEKGFDDWQAGELIQNALPELSTDDREFLISSISPEGWRLTFGEDDDSL